MTDFLHELRMANRQRQCECDPLGSLTLLFFACELAGEVGELCNMVKKLERMKMQLPGSHVEVRHLAMELADVVIVADLIADKLNVDLKRAITEKFNHTSKVLVLRSRLNVEEGEEQ